MSLKGGSYMKKQIIPGIVFIACVALYAAVWPRSAEEGKVPAEPVKPAVNAEIGARSEETPSILLAADTFTTENELPKTDITEEKIRNPEPTQETQTHRPSTTSTEPHMGDFRVVNGEKQIYILGFVFSITLFETKKITIFETCGAKMTN